MIGQAEIDFLSEPQLRLFLSVDLVGSTKFKQQKSRDPTVLDDWREALMAFIEGFPQKLDAEYQRTSSDPGAHLPIWKILGDEIAFSAPIRKGVHLSNALLAFQAALRAWNEGVQQSPITARPLPVKGAAWVAGFPVFNAIIPVRKSGEATGYDYVGPAMDAGFRIATLARPTRMAVTVELAWLLCRVDHDNIKFHFEGPAELKGIAEGTGYPEIWIEVQKSTYQHQLDDLSGKSSPVRADRLMKLCEAFMLEHGVTRDLPFLLDEDPKPLDYDKRVAAVREGWLRRYPLEPAKAQEPAQIQSQKDNALVEQIARDLRRRLEVLRTARPHRPQYSSFTPDPDNPGWIRGWGVVRKSPWHLAGFYETKELAETARAQLGDRYLVAYGSHLSGSDDFVWSSSDQPSD